MGQIKIELPKDAEDIKIQYEKIADREEVIGKELEEIWNQNVEYHNEIVAKDDLEVIRNIDDGVYQIQICADDTFEFQPMIVSMPSWDEEMHQMSYDVAVIPKYSRNIKPPMTGDRSIGSIYLCFAVISFIIVAFMSCHKCLKCGRMSHKNSKKRRT